jgi:hypothetical protein
MDPAAPVFGLLGLAAVLSSLAALVHVSARAWLRWRDGESTQRLPEADTARMVAALQEQVGRVERALEAQGVDLERLAEAQRFAARLLAERAPGAHDAIPGTPGAGRVITPH